MPPWLYVRSWFKPIHGNPSAVQMLYAEQIFQLRNRCSNFYSQQCKCPAACVLEHIVLYIHCSTCRQNIECLHVLHVFVISDFSLKLKTEPYHSRHLSLFVFLLILIYCNLDDYLWSKHCQPCSREVKENCQGSFKMHKVDALISVCASESLLFFTGLKEDTEASCDREFV